jgi:hypothetical protein
MNRLIFKLKYGNFPDFVHSDDKIIFAAYNTYWDSRRRFEDKIINENPLMSIDYRGPGDLDRYANGRFSFNNNWIQNFSEDFKTFVEFGVTTKKELEEHFFYWFEIAEEIYE